MKKFLYSLATDRRNGIFAGIIKSLLFVLSFLYGLSLKFMIFCYGIGILKRQRLNCKVISVGNITLGGTGKTPFVEALALYLKGKNRKVAILSRGYKRLSRRKSSEVKISYETMGDEPFMLLKNTKDIPILVGTDRVKNARKAIKDFGVDTIILDDGFQYWRLFRDLDIVMIDAGNPFGNGMVLPRGILREYVSSLRRADILVIVTAGKAVSFDTTGKLKKINPRATIFHASRQPAGFFDLDDSGIGIEEIKKKKLCILSSIGNPDSFYFSFANLGIEPALKISFPDHHSYSKEDIQRIISSCRENKVSAIVTTQKDAVRLEMHRSIFKDNPQLYYLKIRMQIDKNKEELYERISDLHKC